MTVTDSDDVSRLGAVIDRQRRELDRIRAAAAAQSVVSMARGALMERLGLSSAEAASQLAELSSATGIPLAEMAAAVLSPDAGVAVAEAKDAGRPQAAGGDGAPGDGAPGDGALGDGALGDGAPGDGAPGDDGAPADVLDGPGAPGPGDGGPGRLPLIVEAAAELAADGAELAGTLAAQVLGPLGADAVALWVLEADGALTLLGGAGLSTAGASRWRYIPLQLDCPAQRVARGAPDLWWNAGRPARDSAPVVGQPGGARAVLALRERNGELLGVMEAMWPEPLATFGTEVRQQLSALAAGCARVVGARLAHGNLAAAQPKAAVFALLDDLADSVLAVRAIRDDSGRVTDFSIEHVSPGFRDPSGQTGTDLTKLTLLEAYPASVAGDGLFAVAMRVLASGDALHLPAPCGELPAGRLTGSEDEPGLAGSPASMRATRFFDGVIFTWQREGSQGRPALAALLDDAQRLGRLGGWEENLLTGTVRWTDSAFDLFGLVPRPGAEIPLADLHSYVIAADKPVVQRLRQWLAEQRQAGTATFRVVHPDDGSIRQIRVFAEPVVDAAGTVVALRGAFQDVSAHYHTQVALAATRDQLADTEQRVAEEHLLALRLQQAIMPPDEQPVQAAGIDVAVRYRPAGEGHLVGGDWYDTLLLPGRDVLVVVGDVAGHGIDALTGMVAARYSLRGLAITGAGPAELLRMLNRVVCHLTAGVVGTVVCGLYNADTRVLRWARAGHLPPVLVRGGKPGSAWQLPMPGGVLLGMDPDATYEEATLSLEPGDTLLLFTDGLIERRGESIEDVLNAFIATFGRDDPQTPAGGPGTAGSGPVGAGLTAADQADRVLARAAADTADDACLVAVRIL
ncbi:MAG TPA: SpoIIE family protein phosphatase [Streptosporangiaceae bacterium]|nr:SpoIIE family protein phosphatase [Streptosporangiaceae bacterium]